MLDSALDYALRGWPVFPVQPRSKIPATAHGCKDATCDADRITQWWQRHPDCNIGVATGIAFDVLDLDGLEACDALDEHQPIVDEPLTGPMVRTARGIHIYMRVTGHGNRAGMLSHVDWRGRGGYVIAPPSIHPDGAPYEWTDHGPDSELRAPPDWLLALIDPPRDVIEPGAARATSSNYGARALDGEIGKLVRAREGERNHALNAAAFALGQLAAAGVLEVGTVASELLFTASRVGLDEREAKRTIESGMVAGARKPRTA